MPVQIGMSCDPNWLCDGLSWLLAIIIMFLAIGLVSIIFKEKASRKKPPFPIKFHKKSVTPAQKKRSD